jgi:DNA-binding MurR/RpiR family transcriptional regulator
LLVVSASEAIDPGRAVRAPRLASAAKHPRFMPYQRLIAVVVLANLARLAHDAVRDFGAEAVFVVSNKPTTTRLVHALERAGIPAFGPIWDS